MNTQQKTLCTEMCWQQEPNFTITLLFFSIKYMWHQSDILYNVLWICFQALCWTGVVSDRPRNKNSLVNNHKHIHTHNTHTHIHCSSASYWVCICSGHWGRFVLMMGTKYTHCLTVETSMWSRVDASHWSCIRAVLWHEGEKRISLLKGSKWKLKRRCFLNLN